MNEDDTTRPIRRLPPSFFVRNRQNLKRFLGGNYLALLAAGRPPLRTADETYPFFANRNFFYLTGIEEENAILLLSRLNGQERDILFIQAKDPLQERWTGTRISRDQAAAVSGLAEVSFLAAFEGVVTDLLGRGEKRIWLDQSASGTQAADLRTWLEARLYDTAGQAAGQIAGHDDSEAASANGILPKPADVPEAPAGVVHDFADLVPFLIQLRMQKSPEEIALVRQAIELTGRGIAAMLANVAPGQMEYQLWSRFQQTLAMEGCLEPAFPTIVASGANVFCLHYDKHNGPVRDGDLVQVDVGAIYGGLTADISRVFPANGRFSQRQLAIYQLVRACQDAVFAMIRPGIRLREINDRCREVAREGLAALGILQPDGAVTEYFWHGVVHHLGMDVHDVANREALLQSGMVLAVEPGIYVPEWQVGIRIEDDVLVTADGCEILSPDIPREAAAIERALQNRSQRL